MAAWLLGVFVLVLLVGFALIRLGWRGRRINRDPVCRDCGFNLHAFRLPDMHGVPAPALAPTAASHAEATHPGIPAAHPGSETSPGAAPDPALIPITVTCPECGGGLKRPKAVRIGERKRMPLVTALGVVMLALALLPLGGGMFVAVSGQDYSKHLPLNVLIFQSRHTSRDTSRLIALELERRLLAKALDPKQIDRVVARALELQADWSTPWIEEWGSVYEAAALANGVSQAQRQSWIANAARLELLPRPQLRRGEPLPIRPVLRESRIAPNDQHYAQFSLKTASIDGQSVSSSGLWSRLFGRAGGEPSVALQIVGSKKAGNYGAQMSQSIGALTVPKDLPPGKHELRAILSINAWESGKPLSASTRELRCEIEIVEDPSPSVTLVPATPELEAGIVAALTPDEAVWRLNVAWRVVNGKRERLPMPQSWYLDLDSGRGLQSAALPVPIQMKAFGVGADGVEHELGIVSSEPWSIDDTSYAAGTLRRAFIGVSEPIEPPFTIVLRPDREAAKATFTLTSIYNGEIRVPVKKVLYSDHNYRNSFRTKQELLASIEETKP